MPKHAYTLAELAESYGLKLSGDGQRTVTGLGTLAGAGPDQLAFLANPGYRDQLTGTGAGAVILSEETAGDCPVPALITPDPYLAWAKVAALFTPEPQTEPGIHPDATVDSDAVVDATAAVGAGAVIGTGCHIHAGAVIGPGCILEDHVAVGRNTRLVARVYLGPGVRLGQRVIVHPGAVIGADGFGLALDGDHWIKVPQTGSVTVGDDCEIGANTTIDRGAIEDTVLDADVRLDNQVQIAHNVMIGAHTAIAGCVGVAGSTRIGRYCMIAGACGIGGHLEICDRVIITAMSTVLDSITEPGAYGSGIPARPQRIWQRMLVRLGRLDEWARRLKRLEKQEKNHE